MLKQQRTKLKPRTRLLCRALEDRSVPATILVTSDQDNVAVDGEVTLREAINSINAGASVNGDVGFAVTGTYGTGDSIRFSVIGLFGVDIKPTTGYTLSKPMTIDGYTEPGSSPNTNDIHSSAGDNAVIAMHVDGSQAGSADGFTIAAPDCTIRGLCITGFGHNGIRVNAAKATIAGNRIGTVGNLLDGNGLAGILVGADSVTIGGQTVADVNVIADNQGDGIQFLNAANGMVNRNYIGLNMDGKTAAGNHVHGIEIHNCSAINIFNNVISGNQATGIDAHDSPNGGGITFINNYIGTDATGTMARGNGDDGIYIFNTPNVTIGGALPNEGNVISGNTHDGISAGGLATSSLVIASDLIGTNAGGDAAMVNGNNGVNISAESSKIGLPGAGNVIVPANNRTGILLQQSGCVVQSNRIGTNAAGTAVLTPAGGANNAGVSILDSSTGNYIGGTGPNDGNIIGGMVRGIDVGGETTQIVGNHIGTDATGTLDLGNQVGIRVGSTATDAQINTQFIPLGSNTIAFNDAGIRLGGTNTVVQGNSIYGNGQAYDGSAATDLAATPVITSAVVKNNQTTVTGTCQGLPNDTVIVDLYDNPFDSSGNYQAKIFIGRVDVTTDANGNGVFTRNTFPVAVGSRITATAHAKTATSTGQLGTTSLISSAAEVTTNAGGTLGGTVFNDLNHNGVVDFGEGVGNVIVFLDANGNNKLDAGEVQVTSDLSDGHYLFTLANDGDYSPRIVTPAGSHQTTPNPPPQSVTGGAHIDDVSIGIRFSQPHGFAVGAGPGTTPEVRVYNPDGSLKLDFLAYSATFRGGVAVAMGDMNGDGVDDIVTGAGPGGGSHVRIFDGIDGHELGGYFAYIPSFTGGVFVAVGDVNGDGQMDVVTGAGPGGGPHAKAFSGVSSQELQSFYAYDGKFRGGVHVAAGDVDGDGKADIITGAGPGGGPHVKVFSGKDQGLLRSFFAYDPKFTGGVFVSAADTNGDGHAEILTGAGAGGGPHVKEFDGKTGQCLMSFVAYDAKFHGGVNVAMADLDGDGVGDILTGACSGGGPHVMGRHTDDLNVMLTFYANDPTFTGGVYVG